MRCNEGNNLFTNAISFFCYRLCKLLSSLLICLSSTFAHTTTSPLHSGLSCLTMTSVPAKRLLPHSVLSCSPATSSCSSVSTARPTNHPCLKKNPSLHKNTTSSSFFPFHLIILISRIEVLIHPNKQPPYKQPLSNIWVEVWIVSIAVLEAVLEAVPVCMLVKHLCHS